jgi:hypothetical protein
MIVKKLPLGAETVGNFQTAHNLLRSDLEAGAVPPPEQGGQRGIEGGGGSGERADRRSSKGKLTTVAPSDADGADADGADATAEAGGADAEAAADGQGADAESDDEAEELEVSLLEEKDGEEVAAGGAVEKDGKEGGEEEADAFAQTRGI